MKKKVYYSDKRSKCTVHIPVPDKDGKLRIAKDRHGNPKINKKGEDVLVMQKIEFELQIGNVKLGTYGKYETDNSFEITWLDKCVADGASSVTDEKTFKGKRNAAAYALELKLEEETKKKESAEKAYEELRTKATQKATDDKKENEALRARIAKLEKK